MAFVSPSQTAALSRRDRVIISSCLVLLTALAWMYLFHLDHQMSAAMEHDRMMADMGMTMDMQWNTADIFFTFAMWAVMMVGMMMASAAPVMLLFAGMQRARGAQRTPRVVFAFSAGYLLVWTAFSAGAALAQWALHQAAMLSPAMTTSSARLSSAILIASGVYQLTPFKGACLTHCRSPLGFLLGHWRAGWRGAVSMGWAHALYCLGCCGALMVVLVVAGAMGLPWVLLIACVVAAEKILPRGEWIARMTGVALALLGVAVAAEPGLAALLRAWAM